jgi:hypothetical protein
MSDDKKGFTVKDRRHFTADGEAREGASGEASPVVPETAPAASSPLPRGGAAEAPDAIDFSSFLLSLAAQAGELLSAAEPHASGGEALAAARQIISVLEMLHGKTEGRRTPEESRLLESLLYELRMAYVDATSGVKA